MLPDIYDDHYDSDGTCKVSIEKENFDDIDGYDSVNLLIIDTYDIKMSELSMENQTYPTIIVRGNSIDGVRKVNRSLILEIKKTMDEIQKVTLKKYLLLQHLIQKIVSILLIHRLDFSVDHVGLNFMFFKRIMQAMESIVRNIEFLFKKEFFLLFILEKL